MYFYTNNSNFELFTFLSWSAYKTSKHDNLYALCSPFIATVYFFFLQFVWITYSKVNIIELEPRVFYWLTGTIYSNISVSVRFRVHSSIYFKQFHFKLKCHLIVAHMTHVQFKLFNWMLVPLTAIALAVASGGISSANEPYCLYFMAALATLCHVHYGVCVVSIPSVQLT
jgi:ethanolaminephosphotransferase